MTMPSILNCNGINDSRTDISSCNEQFLYYALLNMFLEEVLNTVPKKEEKFFCVHISWLSCLGVFKLILVLNFQNRIILSVSGNPIKCCYSGFTQENVNKYPLIYTGYCLSFFIPQKNNLFVCKIVEADQDRLFTQFVRFYCSWQQCLAQSSSLWTNIMKYIANPEETPTEVQFNEYSHDFVNFYAMNEINGLLNQEIWFDLNSKVCRINL